MRKLLPALMLLLSMGAVKAQRGYSRADYKMLDDAKAMLDAGQWVDAMGLYKRLLKVDTTFADVFQEIALCEVKVPGARHLAAGHFAMAHRLGHPDAAFHLAQEYHAAQKFDEAVGLLNEFKRKQGRTVTDAEVDRRISMAQNAKSLSSHPVDLTIRNMGARINSSAHDYCPLVTADGSTIYFTSRRDGPNGGPRDGSGQFYEDIYSTKQDDGLWSVATNVGAPLNGPLMDATVGLSPDGNEMIIYRTATGMTSGDLYISKRAQGNWSDPKPLNERINSPAHEPSATVSPDGQEIYFTSDRSGGFGGRDLYRIKRLPNGEWSQPLNLGASVNTPYDEDAPFLHSDGTTLFFSSNGHNTMGGYDIFKSALLDPDMNVWGVPENLGYPLNTVNDDIYFCLSEDGRTGYFSSERPGGLGGQDICQVKFPSSQIEYVLVRGVVTDGNDEPVKAKLFLKEEGINGTVGVFNTNERTGRYVMVVRPGGSYAVRTEAAGYVQAEQEFHAQAPGDGSREMVLDLQLTREFTNAAAPDQH